MGKGNLGVGEAAWGSKLGIDPSQLNNPEKHVRRAKGCYVDAKRPGAALRRKNTCGRNTSASQCLESWGVKLVWTLVSQPGSSLIRRMSLGKLLCVSLSVFIVEQGKYLPHGGFPVPSPGDLPDPGIKPRSPTLQADSLPSEPSGKPQLFPTSSKKKKQHREAK